MSLNDINSLSHTKWNCKYHMLVEIPPKLSVSRSSFMGIWKARAAQCCMSNSGSWSTSTEAGSLVQRVLCGYGRKEHEPNCSAHQEPVERGPTGRTANNEWNWPVHGRQVTVSARLADRITRLTRARGTEGFARISKTTGFVGGFAYLHIKSNIRLSDVGNIGRWVHI